MKWLRLSKVPRSAAALIVSTGVIVTLATPVSAAPFGLGVFGENIPFGAVTSLSMAINGIVDLQLAPTGNSLEAADSHDVVVSSTDVVGYKLYVYALSSTNLESGSDSIPASGNVTPNTLTLNSWGYNTDGSSNFVGMMLTPREIKSASGPYTNGDTTTVTYKALVPQSTPEGSYTTTIVYTAVPGTF